MASFGIARAVANLATGNQTFTDANMAATPNAALFIITKAEVDATALDNATLCVGAAISTSARWATCQNSQTGVTTSNIDRITRDDACICVLHSNGGSEDSRADFVSFGAGEVTVNWSNAPARAFLVTVVLFEVDNAYCVTYQGNAAADGTITITPGFQADVIIGVTSGNSSKNAIGGGNEPSGFSAGACDAALNQRAWGWLDRTSQTTTQENARMASNRYLAVSDGGLAFAWAHEITAIGATTITITQRTAGDTRWSCILALDLPASQTAKVGTVTTPTATGDNAQTWPNFEPVFVLLGSFNGEAVDTGYADNRAGSAGLSAFTEFSAFSSVISAEDGVTTTNTQNVSDNQVVNLPDDDGSAAILATFVSFDATGWTWNWSVAPATAKVFWGLAIEVAAAGTVYNQSTDGTATPAGALNRETSKSFSGTVTSDGSLNRATGKSFAGTTTPAGALSRAVAKFASGVLTSAGSLTRQIEKVLVGFVTPGGTLNKAISKFFSGVLGLIGTLTSSIGGPVAPVVTWELAERNLPGADTWPLEPRDLDWNLEARAFDLGLETRNLTAQNTWSVYPRTLDWTIKIRE